MHTAVHCVHYLNCLEDNMIEYTTRYDVKKTMYEKFADSAAQHTNEPCFYYYNNTITWAQVKKWLTFAPQVCWQTV